tara:strand:- start:8585 stop:8887 length:303 start_codon:yes stop_codon:yes gene_type:complete
MFSAIASSVISAGASKFLGSATGSGGAASKISPPKFPRTKPSVKSKVSDIGTKEVQFEEFARLGTANQMASLISRHESLMRSVDTSQGSVKGSISRSTIA